MVGKEPAETQRTEGKRGGNGRSLSTLPGSRSGGRSTRRTGTTRNLLNPLSQRSVAVACTTTSKRSTQTRATTTGSSTNSSPMPESTTQTSSARRNAASLRPGVPTGSTSAGSLNAPTRGSKHSDNSDATPIAGSPTVQHNSHSPSSPSSQRDSSTGETDTAPNQPLSADLLET